MADIRAEIEAIVADAADKIAALFRQSAAELMGAFGGTGIIGSEDAWSEGGCILGISSQARQGRERTQEELDALCKTLLAHIARKPGQRVEQIKKELGEETKELSLPLKKLIAEKKVKTKGEKRATKYFPAKG